MTQAARNRIAMRTLSVNACALSALLLAATSAFGGDISLAWDSVNDSQLARYIVYYGSTAALDTHFFSASWAECDDLSAAFAQGRLVESRSVFYVYLPDTETG